MIFLKSDSVKAERPAINMVKEAVIKSKVLNSLKDDRNG